ncbi:tyrosine-type recombinase/integrase [Micromonospora profundi]|uniref:tyrosine-type recombinase/integrase n=1 Tax=Micromonospora profundi TaxID=1420889 RepID=UPI0038103C49
MSIEKRPNRKWRARVRDASGKEIARHFDRKSDAERWEASAKASITRGDWIDPARARVTVGAWAEQWMAAQVQLKPTTRARYEVALRRQVFPTWEDIPLSAVSYAEVAAWVQRLTASGLAPATVRYAHRVLSLVLAHAVRDGRVSRNPAEGVRLPRVVKEEPVFLDHDQVAMLAEACGRYGLLVRFLAYTGLRWGEASALRVSRLDLLRRRVTVAVAFAEVGGELVEGTPKNHQRRSVPIPRFLVDELAAHVAGKRRDSLVFTAPNGGPLRNTNFRSRAFAPAAASVGLAGLTPHDLRHTAASLAVAAGANVKAVQRMLGHASASMTLDVYAGLFGDDLDAVANRLDEAVAARDADYLRTGTVGGGVVDLGKRRSPGR